MLGDAASNVPLGMEEHHGLWNKYSGIRRLGLEEHFHARLVRRRGGICIDSHRHPLLWGGRERVHRQIEAEEHSLSQQRCR